VISTAAVTALLSLAAAAVHEVREGGDAAGALARSRRGDVVRLGAGVHRAALRVPPGVVVEGFGAERTRVVAPEGQDAAIAEGDAVVRSATLVAGSPRCALRVVAGEVRVERASLVGGACGARVSGGALRASGVAFAGDVGLLVAGADVEVVGGTLRGASAAVALQGGSLRMKAALVEGPFREAALSAAGGTARLEGVVLRAPGPAGIAVEGDATVEALGLVVSGGDSGGIPGACVQVRRGAVALSGSSLLACGGVALQLAGGTVRLAGVDASGGISGCLALAGRAGAELDGNLCAGTGPGLAAASGSRAAARMNRWWTDPVFWVDCASGARVALGEGERSRAPCAGSP
jgi:hypothetical protein